MNPIKKCMGVMLVWSIMLSSISTYAAEKLVLKDEIARTAQYLTKKVSKPQVNSVGGEWLIMALARSEQEVPKAYYENYYKEVEAYVKAHQGILHDKKYTEYSRVILALTSIGKDPKNVAGYNLLTPLGDFNKSIWQGVNGPIFALIALDSYPYTMPVNKEAKVQATREMYIEEILKSQLADGGFALASTSAEPDMTAMALQALAKYTDNKKVAKAVNRGLKRLSLMQNEKGGYTYLGKENSESVIQVIMALCELGIDINDSRFVKNGYTLLDNLMTFRKSDGSFIHAKGDLESDGMATEQALYAMVNLRRIQNKQNSFYNMKDVKTSKTQKKKKFKVTENRRLTIEGNHEDKKQKS